MNGQLAIVGASAVGKPVIEKSIGKILEWIGEPVSLLFNFKDNAKDLKKKVSLLEDKKNTVEKCEQTAGRRGEETVDEFQKWQTDASTLIGEARVLEADGENAKNKCFFGLCLNPWSRYKFSKKAKKKSESLAQHVSKAVTEFNLSYSHVPAPDPETALPVKGYEDFSSRRGVLDQIMEELREESRVNMIGLHGMAGEGKTTIIKEVKRKAEEVKLFDMVVLAKVTNKPEQEKIQKDIARGIGMDLLPAGLDSHQVTSRIKAKLLEIMKKGKKVLVIFDDLWATLDLEEVGIPFQETDSSKLKILMTSRDCNVLECQKKFAIGQLGDEEAWQLFEKIVGDKAEHPELRPIGEEIVKECGGLPLAIATLANALKKGILHEWRTALTEVRSPSPHNFTGGIYCKVYTAIEVSFNHLETEELKQTLLLCCMMDHGALVQDLLRYGVGLGLFPRANTIEEARDKLFTLIGSLKAASLLIDGSYAGCFDMHDLIYDVAISIARRDRQGLLLMNEASQNLSDMESVEGFKWIILESADFIELFDWSKCSNLALLSIVHKVPENAFERMESLKVLELTRMDMPSLPSSICFLKKLHTLRLRDSRLGDMSLIGELKSLEILDLQGSKFEELPREIGELTRLKSLDLRYCYQLVVIPPRVLESLTRLEELYLDDRFSWGALKGDESRENSNLYELKHLKKLTTLHTKIADVTMIPEDLLSSNLKSYRIFIGGVYLDPYLWSYNARDSHDLRLLAFNSGTNIYQCNECPINPLLKTVTLLKLENFNGVKNLVDEINNEGFPHLKDLSVVTCPALQHITNSRQGVLLKAFPNLEVMALESLPKLEKVFQGRFEETSFSKLRKVKISECAELKILFSSSIARQLVQLQELEVNRCSKVEVIVDDMEQAGGLDEIVEATEAVNTMFGEQLRILKLHFLPKLVSLKSNCRSKSFFNDQVIFPNLEKLDLKGINANALWHTTYFTSFSSVENLVDLSLHECRNLEYLFSSAMVKSFVKLKNLQISGCDRMEKVIVTENEEDLENVIFPALELLSISEIPKLVGFYIGICRVEFPYLKELILRGFSGMKEFAITPTSADNRADALFNEQVIFPNLEKLRLKGINALWHTTFFTSFSFVENLVELSLSYCDDLEYFFPSAMVKRFVKLKKLEISCCYEMKKVIAAENDEDLENVIFPALELLSISGTPNLVGFYIGTCRVEFPYLKELRIGGCSEMKGFAITPTSANNGADIHTLFNEQVRFSKLKKLSIGEMESLIKICDDQLDGEIFCKLSKLSVDSCGKLMNLFPIYILKRLHQLEISGCPSLEEICGSLEKNASQSQDSTGTHPTLVDDEVKDDIVFHKLKHLKLRHLERLKFFCSLKCKVEFPSLEKAIVMGCPRMQNFSTGQSITPKLRKVFWKHEVFNETGSWKDDLNSTIAEMFAKKVGYSSLEFLSLVTFPELITIWDKKPQEFLNFRILKTLKVCNITSLSYLLTPAMALDLVQLYELEIKNCNAMEQVILVEVSEAALFPNLWILRLQYLPKLTSFCSGKSIELFRLQELELWHCYSLKTFITSSNSGGMIESSTKAAHTSTPSLFDAKVGVPNLLNLTIGSTESFDKIWDDHLGADAFCKLNYLFVAHCGNLLYIFPSSILDRLHQLMELQVWGCYSLEEILGSAKQSATWSQDPMSSQSNLANNEVMDGIIFGELEHLELCSLGRLKTFCSLKCKVELPSLEKAIVMGCPSMQHFCTGEPTTPKLEYVHWTPDAEEGSWKGDLNTTIQEMFIKKVGYSSFEFLDLGSFPEFISIWNKIPQETLNFKILQRLYVCNIKSLSYLLTPSMASDLVQLCELKIMNCDAMEQVIVGEVPQGTLLLSKLVWLWLEDLPKLTSFCVGNSIELSCLEKLQIHKCHLLTTFIASSNPGDDTPALFDAKATFRSLVRLELEYGDVIIEIWRGENPGDHFPKLTDVELINFPEQSIELPTLFLQSLPKLKNLEVNGVSREISQKHGANLVIEDMRMSGRHYEIGECSGARSANVLEENNSNASEEENVNASEEKDEADESENNSNDLEESNGGRQ